METLFSGFSGQKNDDSLYAYDKNDKKGYKVTRAWIQLLQAMYLNLKPKNARKYVSVIHSCLQDLRDEMGKLSNQFQTNKPEDAFEGAMSILSALHCEWINSDKICNCNKQVQMGHVDDDNETSLKLLQKHEKTHGSIISHFTHYIECTVVMSYFSHFFFFGFVIL